MSIIEGYLGLIYVVLAIGNNNIVLTKSMSEIWGHCDIATDNKNKGVEAFEYLLIPKNMHGNVYFSSRDSFLNPSPS